MDSWRMYASRVLENDPMESVHKLATRALVFFNSLGTREASLFIWCLVILAFAYHFLYIRPRKNGPPLIKGWIPFANYVFIFLPYAERLLRYCRNQYGDIYTLCIRGKRLHVVLDPTSGMQIFREHRTFTFSGIIDHAEMILFGIPHSQAADPILRKETLASLNQYILSQKSVDGLTETFGANLRNVLSKTLNELDIDGKLSGDGVVLDMGAFITKILFECTGKTLFGETWPSDDSLLHDIVTYDKYVPKIVKGYPYPFKRKGILARERILQHLVKLLEKPLINPSVYVANRKEVNIFQNIFLKARCIYRMGIVRKRRQEGCFF